MNPFNKLPDSMRSAPGLERTLWRRLPALLLWGTVLPLLVLGLRRLAAAFSATPVDESVLQMWGYAMLGVVTLHWSLLITLGLGCVIVMVMKGPGYVADGYPLPVAQDPPPPTTDTPNSP